MRLIDTLDDEKKAYAYINYLREQGVEAIYESMTRDAKKTYSIWVLEEDDVVKIAALASSFQTLSKEERARLEKPQIEAPPSKIEPSSRSPLNHLTIAKIPVKQGSYPLTYFLLSLCAILFLWNSAEKTTLHPSGGSKELNIGLTPIERALFFDVPSCFERLSALLKKYPISSLQEIATLPDEARRLFAEAETCRSWNGVLPLVLEKFQGASPKLSSFSLFEKIREKEFWRLFTPVLLHQNFLHILFNMSWLVLLGKMIEERIGFIRMLGFILITAALSNTAQYLMGGPYFLGFSGVVSAMVGFIWMRQSLAPWEGYPLSHNTTLFLLLFALAMLLLQLFSIGMEFFGLHGFATNIANTAHIAGALSGILLARIPIFSKSPL